MLLWFGYRLRHPLYPALKATPAAEAQGSCDILAGAFQDLLDAAARGVTVRRGVWVLNAIEECHRSMLWDCFQVPILALLLDPSGAVVAYECEAQSGLHVSPRFAGDLVHEECACGRPGPRIAGPSRRPLRA
jgi:hypothetical protein